MISRALAATFARREGAELIRIEHPYDAGPIDRWRIRRLVRRARDFGPVKVRDESSRAGLVWLGRVGVTGPWHVVHQFAREWDRKVKR